MPWFNHDPNFPMISNPQPTQDYQRCFIQQLLSFSQFLVLPIFCVFNAKSFREGVEPVLIASRKDFYSIAGIKLSQQNMQQTITAVEKLWNQAFPDFVFEYQLDYQQL